jgi:hypothetical protein
MIRPVVPSDLWSLRRKPRNQIVLHTESLLAQSHQPVWFALRCLVQGNSRDRSMMVLQDHGASAIVQAMGRSGRPELDIIYLATTGVRSAPLPSDYDLWFRVLERLCFDAGRDHVQRLYVALPGHHREAHEIFRQLVFQVYTRTTVLHLSGPDWDQGTTLAPMRSQTRRDHWAIHKLYGAVTPHMVQHAEVRNARHWALPIADGWKGMRRLAWVLGPDDNLVAYLGLASGSSGHIFSILMRPDARDAAVDVLRFGLAQLTDHCPVYLHLREYQQELLAPAQDLGFQPIFDQTLLVKNTVIPVRRPLLVASFDTGLEPQVTASRISTSREDPQSYVRST